jgi:hypothetical protein
VSPQVWTESSLAFFLHEGAVFYLQDRSFTSAEPHYFVVLNRNPATQDPLILVVSSSQLESVKRRNRDFPQETLIEIPVGMYADFKKDSIISCNQVFEKSRRQLLEQLNNGGGQKAKLPADILHRLRQGVLASPTVERRIKKLLS